MPARVLDVSGSGIQIELESALRLGAPCDVRVIVEDGERCLHGTVRRCRAWGYALDEKDRRVLLYRAGIEFDALSPECLAWLQAALLTPELGGPSPSAPGPTATDAATQPRQEGEVAGAVQPPPAAPPRVPRDGPVKIRIDSAAIRRILQSKKG